MKSMQLASVLRLLPFALLFILSQRYWINHLRRLGARLIPNKTWRRWVWVAAAALYLALLGYNLGWFGRGRTPVRLTVWAALLEAPFRWWVVSCLLGFFLAALLGLFGHAFRAAGWVFRRAVAALRKPPQSQPVSPTRRQFLERAAIAVSAAPFAACAYGLVYERLDLETTYRRIKLRRLPKAFQGFRVAQLSDIHIGPFMPAEEIRKCVAIANQMKPDLVVLTGDFVTWDPSTQGAVVQALAGLKAPFGIFGCLGNHEMWTETEDSISRLFAQKDIRILRQQSVSINSHGERLNLIGVDFETRGRLGRRREGFVATYLWGTEQLVARDAVNILLSHNPNTFDRAAELGIDLSLAGHTHGGQLALEFVHKSISPSNFVTDYVKGWFEKSGSQLYVNRGIGTIGVPIRLNAPPEISLFELVREA